MHSQKNNFKNSQAGFSLILTLLILAGMLAAALAISDIAFRVTRSVGNASNSEMAYYGAETAIEKAFYEINKGYQDINDSSSWWDEVAESLEAAGYDLQYIKTRKACQTDSSDSSLIDCLYTASSPTTPAFKGSLEPGQSYELDLDIKTESPYSATIKLTGSALSDVSLTDLTLGFTGIPEDEVIIPGIKFSIGQDYDEGYFVLTADNFHKIRVVNNSETEDLNYEVSDSPIVELRIKTSGEFHNTERQLISRLAKWHIYGSDGGLLSGGDDPILEED